MDDQNKNLFLATALSFVVILAWFWMFPPEEPQVPIDPAAATQELAAADATTPSAGAVEATAAAPTDAVAVEADAPRVAIETPELSGSISLLGGRIDDVYLSQYRLTLDDDAETVRLLRPVGEKDAYYASFGWAAAEGIAAEAVPGPDTLWSLVAGTTLTPETPVTLSWDNGAGQIFRTVISIDEKFMFTFVQSIENTGASAVSARPYGLLRRVTEPNDLKNFFVLHEGLVRVSDGILDQAKYKAIRDYTVDERERTQAERVDVTEGGWIGYTDHYWMTTIIPSAGAFRSVSKYFESRDLYQAEAVMEPQTVAAGGSTSVETRLFVGAKEWEAIQIGRAHV